MREYDPSSATGSYGRGMESDPDDRNPEEIRVEIAQTRTEMTGTIDAIQQRLAPQVLGEQAKEVARDATEQAKAAAQEVLQDAVREVKDAAKEVTEHAVHEVRDAARDVTTGAKDAAWDATIGRAEDAVSTAGETAKGFGSIMIDTVKQHPIPAALAGLSLWWLYTHRAGGQASGFASAPPPMYQTPGQYRTQGPSQAYPIRTGYASQAERDAMTARGGMTGARSVPSSQYEGDNGSMIGNAGQMASDAASSAGQMVSDVASSAGHMASGAASSAGHMASSAGETAVDAGSGLLDLIKSNPVPAALVGIGLSWLYMNRSSGQPDYNSSNTSQYRYSGSQAYRADYSSTSGSGGVSGMVGRATEQVGDLASTAQDRVGDLAGTAQERVGDMAGTVQEHVSDMAGTVMDQTQRAPGQIQRMIQERPLTAAAVAASLGAAVGLWLPPTTLESKIMGSAHDQVMGRAQEVASDTMEKVQAVAGETMDKVQDAAKDVRSTLKEGAQSQGLTV